jgi:pyruvate/2-oxoglutarate dehydrogenase complex dihydrolipoamide acyltransferase (E2) component
MPKWGDTMQVGVIVAWAVEVGDAVTADQEIATVETDKVDAAVTAPEDGLICELLVAEGDAAPVGTLIAIIETP